MGGILSFTDYVSVGNSGLGSIDSNLYALIQLQNVAIANLQTSIVSLQDQISELVGGEFLTGVEQPTGTSNFVFLFSNGQTQTVPIPGATASSLLSIFEANPTLLVNALNSSVQAFPTSNGGAGSGFYLYGSLLAIGSTP